MIGWGELGEWITMGLVGFLGMVAVAVLMGVVCDVISAFQRSLRGAGTTLLSIEEVMERIPDEVVTYQELPGTVVKTTAAAAGAATRRDDSTRETCVICMSAYEPAGEACGVLPDCEHVFHKLCVATWLRLNSTCPVCRKAFAVTDDDDARQDNAISAVENMV